MIDFKNTATRIFLLGTLSLGAVQGCYMSWDEITYQEPCDPLNPELECGARQRCQPQLEGDPICEGPVSYDKSRQDEFCNDNEDCSVDETCMKMDELLPAKTCMRFCQEDPDCPKDYSCMKTGAHQMEIRGQAWGVCFTVTPAPSDWECDDGYYAGGVGGQDNQCDCGCVLFDPDCVNDSEESCEMCTTGGIRRPCTSNTK